MVGSSTAARGCGMRVWVAIAIVVAVVAALGHRWLVLGWQAWHYGVASPPARTQVVVDGDRAYVAAGADGIEVVGLDMSA